jgi:hypothetical protein
LSIFLFFLSFHPYFLFLFTLMVLVARHVIELRIGINCTPMVNRIGIGMACIAIGLLCLRYAFLAIIIALQTTATWLNYFYDTISMNNIEMCFLSFITMIVSPFISVVIGKIMVPLLFMNDYLMVDFLGASLCVSHSFHHNQSHTFVATYRRFTPFISQRNGSFQPDDNPYNPPSAIEIISLYATSLPTQAVFNVR